MAKVTCNVPFTGTEEQKEQLLAVIDRLKDQPGCLMPICQQAQQIYGYLPEEVQNYIAKELDIPVSDIYGVATFYAQFNLEPKGKYIISVCMGTACYVKCSQQVLDKLEEVLEVPAGRTTKDGLFTLNATRCLGACGLAPVIMVNDDVYGRLTPDQVAGVIEKYRN
jgi:NADP-reducing hydrogenase subunit HndA